ncbi:Uncharacterised protein [BD1-7 clade bacterium]|uniref:Thioredoxin domain-containing protein n=1 Tax=BD1-7 clade bacterium TaxID=2029982 RepID=A0A5S9QCX1_9GAMM|nr:Uncharacterised protein [BD1-7 clade bacterium]CAA0118813.1 Uncharacterised protein [BD1-7 clade bacterium]
MKRYFVMPYLITLLLASVYGVYAFFANDWEFAWLGLTLSCLPMLLFIIRLGISGKARTREHLYSELLVGAVFALAVWVSGHKDLAGLVFLLSVVGVYLYDFWYSDLSRVLSPRLGKGEILPDLRFTTIDGEDFHTKNAVDRPAIFMFIRGNWCPLCVAQVHEIAQSYRRLEDMGASVFVISPQAQEQSQKLAADLNAPLTLLTDKDGESAKKLGVWQYGGVPAGVVGYDVDTNWPTVIVTMPKGKIIYSAQYSNYRVRPEPDQFIEVLEKYLDDGADVSNDTKVAPSAE